MGGAGVLGTEMAAVGIVFYSVSCMTCMIFGASYHVYKAIRFLSSGFVFNLPLHLLK